MKYKYFLKNLSIFTISSFITKALLIFMLPLYTSALTSEEYGTIDVIATTVQLAIPIFTLCITEAIIRFTIDGKNDKSEILKISYNIFFKGYIFIALISFIMFLRKMDILYIAIFNVYYITSVISNIYTFYLKGLEKIKVIGIASVVRIIVLVSLNCIMLIVLKKGLIGYYISLILSELVCILILYINVKKYAKKNIGKRNKKLEKEMIDYSKHFILNSVSWWINNASDKYILLMFYDMGLTGLYSVSYKIPTIIEFVQNIFSQAWQISAIKEYDNDDSKRFFSNMYKYYNCVLVFTVFFIMLFLKVIARILFAKDFYDAWRYVPFLLIAILFGALSGFLGSVYAANKDSKMYAKSTVIGAVGNIILNFILIPKFGAYGAAIATCLSYLIIWGVRLKFMGKYMKLEINLKLDIISYILLAVQAVIILIANNVVYCLISLIILVVIGLLYINIFNSTLKIIKEKIKE